MLLTRSMVTSYNLWTKQDLSTFLPSYFDVSMKNLVFKSRPKKGEHSKKNFDSSRKVSREGHRKTYSKCGVVGHTKTTCSKQVVFLFPRDEWFLADVITLI